MHMRNMMVSVITEKLQKQSLGDGYSQVCTNCGISTNLCFDTPIPKDESAIKCCHLGSLTNCWKKSKSPSPIVRFSPAVFTFDPPSDPPSKRHRRCSEGCEPPLHIPLPIRARPMSFTPPDSPVQRPASVGTLSTLHPLTSRASPFRSLSLGDDIMTFAVQLQPRCHSQPNFSAQHRKLTLKRRRARPYLDFTKMRSEMSSPYQQPLLPIAPSPPTYSDVELCDSPIMLDQSTQSTPPVKPYSKRCILPLNCPDLDLDKIENDNAIVH